jgi:hypothetical protein
MKASKEHKRNASCIVLKNDLPVRSSPDQIKGGEWNRGSPMNYEGKSAKA